MVASAHTMVVVETSLPLEGTIDEYRRSRANRRARQRSRRALPRPVRRSAPDADRAGAASNHRPPDR